MPSGEAPVAEERAKEWLQCVEVGGKELVQSLEDSHLRKLYLALDQSHQLQLYYTTSLYFKRRHSIN